MIKYENGVAFLAIIYNVVIGVAAIRLVLLPAVVLIFLSVDFFLVAYYVFFLLDERKKMLNAPAKPRGARRK
jgi:hypothetical protein